MIEKILHFQSDELFFFHVRMNFSTEIDDIGKVQVKKFIELFRIILAIWWYRIVHNANILYYPPAGPDKVPIFRDIIILLTTRFLFKKTIYHFHAGGISQKYPELKPIVQYAFRKAYFHPELTIRLSHLNPDDGNFLKTKKDVVIPYGIDDVNGTSFASGKKAAQEKIQILFTGLLKESKGVNILLEATTLMVSNGYSNFSVSFMGRFESGSYECEIRKIVVEKGLEHYVQFIGVKTGVEKFTCFQQCDIFCFPSFYEAETFGIVLLEAMQFAKPVVATKWRGIPDIIKDGANGLLVEPQNAEQVAAALLRLINDEELRKKFGEKGQAYFRENYTTDIFRQNFQKAVKECVA